MKTKLIIGIIFCFITCLGCSKDSDDIPCGEITEISAWPNGLGATFILTVEMSDGSIRFASHFVNSFKVGDEYCKATRTTKFGEPQN